MEHDHYVGMRFTPADRQRLEELAAAMDVGMSAVVRELIAREHARRFGEPSAAAKTKRSK